MAAFDYLESELQRLDVLLHREILRLRAAYQLSLDEFRGLYVSDQQVDNLVRETAKQDECPDELTRRAEAMRVADVALLSDDSPWQKLRRNFKLSEFEIDVVLLGVAVDVYPKYETICAYLNNDVSRKWPTFDLALRLFAPQEGRAEARNLLSPQSRLVSSGILRSASPPADRSAWLSTGFSVAQEVLRHLLGVPRKEQRINDWLERVNPSCACSEGPLGEVLKDQMERIPELFFREGCDHRPLLVFVAEYGMGAEEAAELVCARGRVPLLYFDLEAARGSEEPVRKIAQALVMEQRLEGTGIFIRGCGVLFGAEGHAAPEAQGLISALAAAPGPVILAFPPETRWRDLLRGRRKLVFALEPPDYDDRRRLWRTMGSGLVPEETADDLANRFALTPGQIRDAIAAAKDMHRLQEGRNGSLRPDELMESARAQSDQSLGKLALQVHANHTWRDLVLPPSTLRQVKEVASAIRFRHRVYSGWGFDQRLVSGNGLAVLFSGMSGTGKTMTAGVIARDLGVELYKIDLSGVVSKFIGETEKNLDRIFHAAISGNAILFFDEADALFGKRSEVKDAHDRYANIEVAYLLQKLEDHDGVVILASNLSKNLDEAFSRRMHYVIEFPLPNSKHREQLWRGMFPPQAPRSEDVDFGFLAEQFPLPGGDIRNVVLSAAFQAAEEETSIHMRHLIPALGRLMVKKGKIPTAADFKQYHEWLQRSE